MKTAVETIGCYPSPDSEGGYLDVVRMALDHNALIEEDDPPLRELLGAAALIDSKYTGKKPVGLDYLPRESEDGGRHIHMIAVGAHHTLRLGEGMLGFVLRQIDHSRSEVYLPVLSAERDPELLPDDLRLRVGNALLDGVVQDLSKADVYEVRLSIKRVTGVGQKLLIGQRGFMGSSNKGAFATSVKRLRLQGRREDVLSPCRHAEETLDPKDLAGTDV